MKKVIYLILICLISISVVGCGSNKKLDNQQSKIDIEKLENAILDNPPKIAGPYLKLCSGKMQNKDFEGAIKACNDALKYEPNNQTAQKMLEKAEEIQKHALQKPEMSEDMMGTPDGIEVYKVNQ